MSVGSCQWEQRAWGCVVVNRPYKKPQGYAIKLSVEALIKMLTCATKKYI